MSNDTVSFLVEFVKDPMTVASVTPSSPALARRVAACIPLTGDPVVVELGPGTGAFTEAIQLLLADRGRHIAIDVNARFISVLAARFGGLDAVTADAADLAGILAARGLRHADFVVSGLPWAAFRPDRQQNLLDAVVDALSPDGAFTTFAYLHSRWAAPARRLRRSLEDRFEEVVLGRTVWSNLPPALVYHCRRPRPAPQP
jgi:phospholipid N-methyltransferase